ncbi:response regulator [Bdellovibrio sp. ZAP7]|uniref:response regulator n=1 Tax=Bdellovibrio sp. ZAP7 TaxID=2231053 RepID=UPI001FEEECB6|nr:response regulator [Bdellovibrio sp. ZAP7]
MMESTENNEPRSLAIHLIEDDDDHAGIVVRLLARSASSSKVERSRDGEEAIEYLEQAKNVETKKLPDLILLDLKLPKKDGHEVLQFIKQDPVLHSIPVVILSTSDAESDRIKAYELYANSYLVKPLELGSFKELTDEIIRYWGVWNTPATEKKDEAESKIETSLKGNVIENRP